ncbi:hypothetical protein [Tannockella kyphosi]|uniref:hypothetical protein n=1 Tax=Tannockella kyphosi TaxID=2899121 RepID=UPI0020128AFB|nr:hypothetical protein [Tannockella kyphosi]
MVTVTMEELGVNATDQQLRTMANLCALGNKGKIGSAKVLLEEDMYQILKATQKIV